MLDTEQPDSWPILGMDHPNKEWSGQLFHNILSWELDTKVIRQQAEKGKRKKKRTSRIEQMIIMQSHLQEQTPKSHSHAVHNSSKSTLSAMLRYSIKALCMIEWSTIPFSRIGWRTEVIWRKTDSFFRPNLEIVSTNLTKQSSMIIVEIHYATHLRGYMLFLSFKRCEEHGGTQSPRAWGKWRTSMQKCLEVHHIS